MILEKKGRVTHSDKELAGVSAEGSADARIARQNIRQLGAGNSTDEMVERMVSVVEADRSRRNGHYFRYRALFRLANDERLFAADESNFSEASLLDMNRRISGLASLDEARNMQGKGISAELSHVDQLGSWGTGRELDDVIRALPDSRRLDDEGFLFADTFGESEKAKITYDFRLVGTPKGTSLMGIRKRAAADVLSPDGHVIDIVKRSSFLIDVAKLEQPQLQRLGKVMIELVKEPKDRALNYDRSVDEAGRAAIEPYIVDKDLRYDTNTLLAATSLYFALYRLPEEL